MKITTNPAMVTAFEGFGYALWFMYFIGLAEVLGALGIAFGAFVDKKLPVLATAGLIVIMIGAIGSHIIFGDPISMAIPAFVFLVLLVTYLWVIKK